MAFFSQSLWLQTFAAIAVLGVGLFLHLQWHPLRAVFSDAWALLLRLPWMVPAVAALAMLNVREAAPLPPADLADSWPLIRADLAGAALDAASLPFRLLPAASLAWLTPLLMVFLTLRLRQRTTPKNPRAGLSPAFIVFALLTLLAWAWAVLEIYGRLAAMPFWLDSLRAVLRWPALAVALAAVQIYLFQLVHGWENPELPDEEKDLMLALEHSVAQWRNLGLLTAVNVFWLLADAALTSQAAATGSVFHWVLVETALFLATAPAVLALARKPLPALLQQTGQSLWRCLPALAGFVITATVLLALTRHAMTVLQATVAENGLALALGRILSALVLATVRSWLFLALVISLLRHGLAHSPLEKR